MQCIAIMPLTVNPPPMLAGIIGANIQKARKAKGWSLEKLAARVEPKTSYQQVSRLEKGRMLTIDWIERLAKALGVDPLDLMALREQPQLEMSEPVANEIAQMLALVALDGREPEPDTVLVLSLMLQELTATFSKHPQAYRDPEVARLAVDMTARRFAPLAN